MIATGPLWEQYGLHTLLFRNCLMGLTDTEARTRPNESTNSVAFIAGHLVESRAWMARYLGGVCPAPFDGRLEHATSIDQVGELPTLKDIESAWKDVDAVIGDRRGQLRDADWLAQSPQRFPGVADTILGGFGFLLHHEAYHIGQLGLLRRFLGHPAMGYRGAPSH